LQRFGSVEKLRSAKDTELREILSERQLAVLREVL
jgi:hypothetical protein